MYTWLWTLLPVAVWSLKGGTNESLLAKFNSHHQGSTYYRVPATKQSVFTIVHYAGKVKYFIKVWKLANISFQILLQCILQCESTIYIILLVVMSTQPRNSMDYFSICWHCCCRVEVMGGAWAQQQRHVTAARRLWALHVVPDYAYA